MSKIFVLNADGQLAHNTILLKAMVTALIFVFVIISGQAQNAGARREGVQAEGVQEEAMTTINIQIGSETFTGKLLDNASARALLAILPMTITMSELNGNEKYYQLPNRLPTNSEDGGTIKTGDLMLYGSDTLVLFYKSFTTSYSYTRLGYVEDVSGLEDALGSGSVEVMIELAE